MDLFVPGPCGPLEAKLWEPPKGAAVKVAAVFCHPHPLYGGTMDNKVVQTLARAFIGLGYACARMNFRGVGQSEGTHDAGIGETDDIALLYEHMTARYPGLPVALSGFSFGTFVQSRLQRRLAEQGRPAERLVLEAGDSKALVARNVSTFTRGISVSMLAGTVFDPHSLRIVK